MSHGGKVERERTRMERAHIAVAQICRSVGFERFSESALEALTDIAFRYLCELGKTANFYANLAGRTECNVFDIVQGLEDLGSTTGFSGASEVGHCLMGSGTLREIVAFVNSTVETLFVKRLPLFPVAKSWIMAPSFVQMGETSANKHIPAWLPAFPDPHTYIQSPIWNDRETDPWADKIELARRRRKAERSLLGLQQRLLCNGSAIPSTLTMASTSTDVHNDGKALEDNETENPYLAKPLQTGEKYVAPFSLPAKILEETTVVDHVSVFETPAPAIEAVKEVLCNFEDSERKILVDKRPAIRLKFKTGKRILGESLDLSLRNKGTGKVASQVGRDDEKVDKKRRAEFILRQSMDNPLEMTQL